MRSGNGRHRRPRQAPALFVAAGVTGAGLALPLLAAGGAQAADGATWDRVAQCESGGLWSANAGNGYYGGLQLTMETWQDYGGTELAERPDLASRSQQIEIAEKILADQGPEAWPSCSISAGLLPDEPEADVPDAPDAPDVEVPDVPEVPDMETPDVEVPDTEVPDTETPDTEVPDTDTPDTEVPDAPDLPDAPDGSTDDGSTEHPTDDGSTDGSEGGSTEGSTDGGSTGDDSTQTPAPDELSGTGSGIGEPTPEITPQAPETDTDTGTDSDSGAEADADGEGTGKHRGSPDDRPRGDAGRPSRGKHGKAGESASQDAYRVRAGDSLSAIADAYDVRGGWAALYEANRDAVGEDPDMIRPGQLLDLRTGGELR